ncbi:MAG: T9SS type A sorting domain-containing protein [Saprospiraceae bacterium]
MKKIIVLVFLVNFLYFNGKAQINCPDDITIDCFSDIWPGNTGMASILSGNYNQSMIKYVDNNSNLSVCNEGDLYRTFYLDVNYNNILDANEGSCTQAISLDYNNLDLNLTFPPDRAYDCDEDVILEAPTWAANPCDLIGYTYEDQHFNFSGGACKKTLRTFTLINWCIYNGVTVDGIWTHTQVIKIIDNDAPQISMCQDLTFDAVENCESTVTLTNSATEIGACPSSLLTWTLSVDLWADGTQDLFYGPNEPLPFKIDPLNVNEDITITLPEKVGKAHHKASWTVTDGCGNVKSCFFNFDVVDNTPPTPYCLNFTSTSYNGQEELPLEIAADFFSLESIDNCSNESEIRLSFSENLSDTVKLIECGDSGFNFFRIYYTDEADNQDFCEVFMLIFDNGTCFGKYAPNGIIRKPNGTVITDAMAYLMDQGQMISSKSTNENGYFSFGNQDIVDTYVAMVKKTDDSMDNIDVSDYLLMQRGLIGLEQLNFYQKIAGDINNDNKFNIQDLLVFKNVILGDNVINNEDKWTFIPQDFIVDHSNSILQYPTNIEYTKYNSGFNFYGIKKGDLTSASYPEVEITDNEEPINMVIEISNDKIVITNSSNFVADAITYKSDVSAATIEATINNNQSINLDYNSNYGNAEFSLEFTGKFESMNVENILKYININIYKHESTIPALINFLINENRISIEKNTLDANTKAYPNPFGQSISLFARDVKKVVIYDVNGQIIKHDIGVQYDNIYKISNLGHLKPGIYILHTTTKNETKVIKIIK